MCIVTAIVCPGRRAEFMCASCIQPRRGVEGSSSDGGTPRSADTGKPKSAAPDEALRSLLQATGLEHEAGRLAEHGVLCVADVDALREEDLSGLGMRVRRLLEHRTSPRAQAQAEALVQLAAHDGGLATAAAPPVAPAVEAAAAATAFEGRISSLEAQGDAEAIVRGMVAHAGSARVQQVGSWALLSLALSNADNQARIVAAGGIEAVVGAMGAHSEIGREHVCTTVTHS